MQLKEAPRADGDGGGDGDGDGDRDGDGGGLWVLADPRKRVASAGAGAGGRAAGDEQHFIQFGQQPAVPCLACKKCDHNHLTHDCPFFNGEDREEDSALRKASLESSADGGGKDVSGCPIQPALICPISSHPLAAVAATCRCM